MNDVIENKLYVEANLIPPQILSEKIYPTKDAYMDQGNPVEPFGDREYLKINSSDARYDDETKIYMTFQVPVLPTNIYENIKGVYLTLYSNSRATRDVTILLRNHYDNGWRENGTTWMAQPYEHPVDIVTYTMAKGTNSVKIDLTDFFMSHNNQEFDVAYVIKEDPIDGHQKPVQFFSKESANVKLRPCIDVMYEKFPEFLDFEDVYARFKARYKVDKGYDPYEPQSMPDLPCLLEVVNKFINVDLDSHFETRVYNEEANLDCKVTVKKKGWIFLNAQLTVRQFVPNETEEAPFLPAILNVKSYVADVEKGNEYMDNVTNTEHVAYPYIEGKFTVRGYTPLEYPELESKFETRFVVPSKPFPNAPSIDCEFKVVHYEADVKEGDEYTEDTDPIISHVPYAFLPSKVTVRNELYIEFNGTFVIPYYYAELPRGSALRQDPDEPWKVYIEAPELDSQVTVQHVIPNDDEPAPELDSKLIVREYKADVEEGDEGTDPVDESIEHVPYQYIECFLETRYAHNENLNSQVTVKEYRADSKDNPDPDNPEGIIHVPAKFLDSQVKTRAKQSDHLDCTFEIPSYTDTSDLDSTVEVKTFKSSNDLECQFSMVRYVPSDTEVAPFLEAKFYAREVDNRDLPCYFMVRESKSLDAQVTVREKRIHDLECTFEIDRDSVIPYSYIM